MKRMICTLTLALLLTAAAAQAGRPPLGPRAGYTSWNGTSQAHVGAQVKLGDIFPNFAFTPNFELGFGDDATILTVNGDLAYRMTEFFRAPWGPYIGASVAFIHVNADGSSSDMGLSGLVGTTYTLNNNNEVFFEIRFSIIDSPDFKATVGYTFF